jgi:acetylornithine deacetylase
MRTGPKGDAALIAEGASDRLLVAGVGMGIFDITVSRPGEAIHENAAAPGTPHPILAASRLVSLMQERAAELAKADLPYLGPESYFIGLFQGGDFYNRLPTTCRIVGTRRYAPEKSFEEVAAELEAMARRVETETGTTVRVDFTKTRDGFRLDEGEPLVEALRGAYREAVGQELPLAGWRSVADAPVFQKVGGVPATYHSPGGAGAHADLESVRVADLARAARVFLLTAVRFAGIAGVG